MFQILICCSIQPEANHLQLLRTAVLLKFAFWIGIHDCEAVTCETKEASVVFLKGAEASAKMLNEISGSRRRNNAGSRCTHSI